MSVAKWEEAEYGGNRVGGGESQRTYGRGHRGPQSGSCPLLTSLTETGVGMKNVTTAMGTGQKVQALQTSRASHAKAAMISSDPC